MPELPEVETVRAAIAPVLTGRRLDRVEIFDPRLVAPEEPVVVAAELEGERVAEVGRRGKYLIVRFESGRALLIHLRMTGSLRHASAHGPDGGLEPDPHRRAVVKLDDGRTSSIAMSGASAPGCYSTPASSTRISRRGSATSRSAVSARATWRPGSKSGERR
jgi:formamidopyrimidine-DNA glycosylase